MAHGAMQLSGRNVLRVRPRLMRELERLRAEIAAIKKQNEKTPDTHNYSEETLLH